MLLDVIKTIDVKESNKKKSIILDTLREESKETMNQVFDFVKDESKKKDRSVSYCLQVVFSQHLYNEKVIEEVEVERKKKKSKDSEDYITINEPTVTVNQVNTVLKHYNKMIKDNEIVEFKEEEKK